MKDLIITLLGQLQDGRLKIENAAYNLVGSSIDFDLSYQAPDADNTVRFSTTCQRYEIIAIMLECKLIIGHDSHTKLVYVPMYGSHSEPRQLHKVYEAFQYHDIFHKSLLELHFNNALNILNYEGDPEDLWPYFQDYNLIEKQALLYLLSQKSSIVEYWPRTAFSQILNYLDGTSTAFSANTPLHESMYARWLKQNDGSLLKLAMQRAPNAKAIEYFQTVA